MLTGPNVALANREVKAEVLRPFWLRRDGKLVEMSPREFSVLWVLLQARGRVLSPAQLHDSLYGLELDVGSNTVNVHVHHLRKKLGSDLIRTLRGVGYTIPK